MATNKRHSGKVDMNNLDEWLRSTGFLFPTNELELDRFNKLYEDYDFKLKYASIDVNSIIEGKVCSFGTSEYKIDNNEGLTDDIRSLKMAARKGQELPEHILDKMIQKHRKNNQDEEQ